jgi:alkanesulfonate monooxygenase SsuD/methylene tetrahydromethanopterin reductase-like flavin-dependent oxidoreductase (luciferase family)
VRFSYAESMVEPSFYAPLAIAAEEAGYDSFVVPDSVAYPEHSDSTYPFNPDGSREFLDGKPFIEPFVLIGALGAVTTRIRFTTFVIKLPVRHPVHTAKLASSAAVLTNNRLALGVGVSPWPDDYEFTETPWAGRGQRMDEAIAILQGLLSGEYHAHAGEAYTMPSIKITPVPSRPIAILAGGHADVALRRAARLDGWMHGGGELSELPALLEKLRRFRREAGREGDPFEVHVISLDAYSADGIKRLEDQGVTDVIVGFRWPYSVGPDTEPLQTKLDALRRYADTVIAEVRH